MKTFDEKDLITWSNREEAVIGNEYYFASSLDTMEHNVEKGVISQLINIDKDDYACTFKGNDNLWYACILPVDAVKENKTYRACKTIKEFYELVSNSKCKMDEKECIYQLISDFIINFRSRNTHTEYYTFIRSISKDENGDIKILITRRSYLSFEQIFNNYEIEINGEWKPFGVEA